MLGRLARLCGQSVRSVAVGCRLGLAEARSPAPPPAAAPTVYVLTAYDFNHRRRRKPIDPRLRRAPSNYVFYFFDDAGVPPRFPRPALAEIDVSPRLHEAGKRHLAEWSFFLAEYERPFLKYPFVAISSRFYEKNTRLPGRLEWYLPRFGEYLRRYGYGYLPSYDRPFALVDLADYHRKGHLGTEREGFDLIQRLYGVRLIDEYRLTGDFWCNYVAFESRRHFERYVEFYLPLLRVFFDDAYRLVRPYESVFVRRTGAFRNEKPLTLFLELVSHLYFYSAGLPYVGLHYDGFYEVSEHRQSFRRLMGW
jgi:hypothetical protein